MNALQFSAAGGALLAAAIGALWLRGDHAPASGASGPPSAASVESLAPGLRSRVGIEAVNSAAPPADSPPPQNPAADLEQRVAEVAYRRASAPYVNHLVARGLSRPDSELVVNKAFHDATACSFQALRVEAERQAVSFDALLDAAEAILYDADGPELAALIDVAAVGAREAPCVLNVIQQAGLPASLLEQVSR